MRYRLLTLAVLLCECAKCATCQPIVNAGDKNGEHAQWKDEKHKTSGTVTIEQVQEDEQVAQKQETVNPGRIAGRA